MDTSAALHKTPVTSSRLWFGFAASACAWALLGFLDILITWRACVHQEGFDSASSHPAARTLYIVVSLALILIVVLTGALSYRNWRALSEQSSILEAQATDRREFMALLGVFVSLTLGMGVIWLSIPPLIIQLCLRAK
jgi:divalent metal cation (Fe/Co/Zn/Cd) transporter